VVGGEERTVLTNLFGYDLEENEMEYFSIGFVLVLFIILLFDIDYKQLYCRFKGHKYASQNIKNYDEKYERCLRCGRGWH